MATVSLCMIVRDEEATLERVLRAMREAADEIIVADTGSSDRTVEIAEQYADQIIQIPWEDDFAKARNQAVSKASMDYWMWLDGDDVIDESNVQKLKKLKEKLDEEPQDVVMMRYVIGKDDGGRPILSYYRERILRNRAGFWFQGQVHEAVSLGGKILYSDIEIIHDKVKPGDKDRNLRIYEKMIAGGKTLDPRSQFYFGRELYDHQRYKEAAEVFQNYLKEQEGWLENKIDGAVLLSSCLEKQGERKRAYSVLVETFLWDTPRAEVCCGLGRMFMEEGKLKQAVYWYEAALKTVPDETSGAFIQKDYYDYIPWIQLCVCWDRLGDRKKAYQCHCKAREIHPKSQAVKWNEAYFQGQPSGNSACCIK